MQQQSTFKSSNDITSVKDLVVKSELSISPNPVRHYAKIMLNSSEEGPISFQVIDQYGRTIWQESTEVSLGDNHFMLPANQLEAGVYVLTLIHKDHKEQITKQFTVQ